VYIYLLYSLAFGDLAHSPGDPVHLSSDYYWFHRFILQTFQVALDCHQNLDCDQTGLTQNQNLEISYFNDTRKHINKTTNNFPVPANFYSWRKVTEIQKLNTILPKYPSNVDYKAIVAKYM
jgi:hypothetical protein